MPIVPIDLMRELEPWDIQYPSVKVFPLLHDFVVTVYNNVTQTFMHLDYKNITAAQAQDSLYLDIKNQLAVGAIEPKHIDVIEDPTLYNWK